MVSVDASSREFLQSGSTEARELQDRLGQLRLHWDTAQGAVDSWREGLRRSLMQCQVRRPRSAPRPTWVGAADIFIVTGLLWCSQMWLLGSTCALSSVYRAAHLLTQKPDACPRLLVCCPGPLLVQGFQQAFQGVGNATPTLLHLCPFARKATWQSD